MDDQQMKRRNFLIGCTQIAGLFAASAATGGMLESPRQPVPQEAPASRRLFDRSNLHGNAQLPEALVQTQDGNVVQLYADLIKGKVVTINFMSIENETTFPISARLKQVAWLLGNRLGRDVHMISISTDPQQDTPQRLREFSDNLGAPAGWHFVRATDTDNTMLAARLYRRGRRLTPDTTIDLIHYGNEAVGLWAAFPATAEPEDAVIRISSVTNGQPTSGPLKQAGPRRLDETGPIFNNRVPNV